MRTSLIGIAAALSVVGLPSAASACDFHGTFGFDQHPRLNPFANADRRMDALANAIREANAERRERSEERAREKGTRKEGRANKANAEKA